MFWKSVTLENVNSKMQSVPGFFYSHNIINRLIIVLKDVISFDKANYSFLGWNVRRIYWLLNILVTQYKEISEK